jgi:hypothetical protein
MSPHKTPEIPFNEFKDNGVGLFSKPLCINSSYRGYTSNSSGNDRRSSPLSPLEDKTTTMWSCPFENNSQGLPTPCLL